MTDNIRAFPQRKPTIIGIVDNGIRTGRPLEAIFEMALKVHPDKPVDTVKAEIVSAIQAGVEGEIGAGNLGDVGAAVTSELTRLQEEAAKPTMPV
jgi:hypothetical protein